MPTCNFYHFLVSFASPASPEDIHKKLVREREKRREKKNACGEAKRNGREAAEESNQKRMQREDANVGESIQQNEGDKAGKPIEKNSIKMKNV